MKAKFDAIIQPEQAKYLDQLLTQGDPLLAEMEAYAAEHRVPIADREVARFVEISARISGARKALEIGMAIGYTVIHLARGMGEDGRVVTIEYIASITKDAFMPSHWPRLPEGVEGAIALIVEGRPGYRALLISDPMPGEALHSSIPHSTS